MYNFAKFGSVSRVIPNRRLEFACRTCRWICCLEFLRLAILEFLESMKFKEPQSFDIPVVGME